MPFLSHDCEATVKVQSATRGSNPFTLIYYESLNLTENYHKSLLLDNIIKWFTIAAVIYRACVQLNVLMKQVFKYYHYSILRSL